jgi:hypothetical protein
MAEISNAENNSAHVRSRPYLKAFKLPFVVVGAAGDVP